MKLIVKLEGLKVDENNDPLNIIEIPLPDVIMTGEHYWLFFQGLSQYLVLMYGEHFYKPAFGDHAITTWIQKRETEV